jgi:hypothetical protein
MGLKALTTNDTPFVTNEMPEKVVSNWVVWKEKINVRGNESMI